MNCRARVDENSCSGHGDCVDVAPSYSVSTTTSPRLWPTARPGHADRGRRGLPGRCYLGCSMRHRRTALSLRCRIGSAGHGRSRKREGCRRTDRRRRTLRDRSGLPAPGWAPGQELRAAGVARVAGRHLGLLQVPGHSDPTPTCRPSATGSGPGWRTTRSRTVPPILRYITETAREYDIERHIVFNHRVVRADWSSPDARWTVTARDGAGGKTVSYTCRFLYVCSGYYRYDQGYVPDFEGMSNFKGDLVHPHKWPEDLDYSDRKVVVIGSGATAVTLVPAMADTADHVTMVQRSPSYILPDTPQGRDRRRSAALRWRPLQLRRSHDGRTSSWRSPSTS